MNEKYYTYTETNQSPLIPILDNSNAKHLLDKHTKDGYVILSAARGFDDVSKDDFSDALEHNATNNKRTKELLDDIQNIHFSYTLLYGGFVDNKVKDNAEEVYEQSVIVYPYRKDGTYNFEELYGFALAMCRKYEQDSILVKEPNENVKYVKQDGSIDSSLDGDMKFNDISRIYFTDLRKHTNKKGFCPTRFTFTQSYMSQVPQSYGERHNRYLKGEIFLN